MDFAEFKKLQSSQSIDDGQGWYETCFTMDGQKRGRLSVRVCAQSHVSLGDSVAGGADGRMGSDIRRWPETALGYNDGLSTRSPRARLEAHSRQLGSLDDRRASHALVSGDQVWLYKQAPLGIALRWRFDSDKQHVQIQLARPATDAASLRQQFVDAGSRHLQGALFPENSGHGYVDDFLKLNDMSFDDVSSALRPRPCIIRVPLLTTSSNVADGRWNKMTHNCVASTHGAAVSLDVSTTVMWCALHGLRSVICDREVHETREPVLLQSVHQSSCSEAIGLYEGGRLQWIVPPSPPTSESVRSYAIALSTANTPHKLPTSLVATIFHSDHDGLSCEIQRDGRVISTAWSSPLSDAGLNLGALYTTDNGLRTGFPLTHTSQRTFVTDPSWQLDGYVNDANDVLLMHTDRQGRAGLLGILHILSQSRAKYVAIEAQDPVWRAQLCGVLKLVPVAHPDVTLPEEELLVQPEDTLALTPDERGVRIKNSSVVVPLLHNRTDMVQPFLIDANSLLCAKLSVQDMSDVLLPSTAARLESVILQLDKDTDCLVAAPGASVPWTNSTVFSFRRHRWRNMMVPVPLKVDRFETLPVRLRSKGSLLVRTSTDTMLLDLHRITDSRSLVLPTWPVYKTSQQPSTPHLMLRPYPSRNDVESMKSFCTSTQCRELFR